ncbi:50S ribosomal protein L32 [Candidatus Uhrbacteria bacterium]|nr:50S ribosomal protein L32 [Candidatus Uhrbacteria bacterium]
MALSGKRLSRSSKRRRASHFALKKKSFISCVKCKKMILPHRACAYCGNYKERLVIIVKNPKLKKTTPVAEEKQN